MNRHLISEIQLDRESRLYVYTGKDTFRPRTPVCIRVSEVLRFVLVAFLIAGFSLGRPARAQQIRAYVSADSVTVGERFFLSLVAEHNLIVEPIFPDETTIDSLTFGDLELIRQLGQDVYHYGGTRIDSMTYEVATFALDTAYVPPIRIKFSADEDTFSVASIPLTVPVISLVPPDAEDIQPLAPLVEFKRVWWPWFLLAATMLLVTAMIVRYYVRRRRIAAPQQSTDTPGPEISPFEEAMERLRLLEETDLYAHPAVKPYYVELSETLRHYLSRRIDVHAMENTTRELLYDLERRRVLADQEVRQIRGVLEISDFVKFADAHPSPDHGRGALLDTHETLCSIEKTLYRPPELVDSYSVGSSDGPQEVGEFE